jgi:pyruvate,orthophosphate dikinase
VFASWDAERARRFREIKEICHSWHTAVIVQEMAFGNRRNEYVGPGMDETQASLTGVIPRTHMTRSGIRALEGEFKFSAAGDDLVGGLTSATSLRPFDELQTLMPMLHRRMKRIVTTLRRYMGTDQEIEFTVERGRLSILQTRMSETSEEKEIHNFAEHAEPLTHGIGVRGGGFRGLVAFDEDDRREMAEFAAAGRDDVDGVLLVLENPTPDDVPLILSADGLLTAKGGSTSHAAVAINGIEHKEFSAVTGARGLKVNVKKNEAVFVDTEREVRHRVRKGDVLSIHGTSGEVYVGSLPLASGDEPGSVTDRP